MEKNGYNRFSNGLKYNANPFFTPFVWKNYKYLEPMSIWLSITSVVINQTFLDTRGYPFTSRKNLEMFTIKQK